MDDRRPLSELLTRLYLWGWVALAPLVILIGLVGYMSFQREFKYFVEGLWIGILNLGILWTGIFLLIAIGSVVISLVLRLIKSGNQNHEHVLRSFGEEFREVYGLGLTILIVIGFISEFLVHSFGASFGLFATLSLGFLPMTLLAVLFAYIRSRP